MTIDVHANHEGIVRAYTQSATSSHSYDFIQVVDVDSGVVPQGEITQTVREKLREAGYTLVRRDTVEYAQNERGEKRAYTTLEGRMSLTIRRGGQEPYWHCNFLTGEPWRYEGRHTRKTREHETDMEIIETNRGNIIVNPDFMDIPDDLQEGEIYQIVRDGRSRDYNKSDPRKIVEWDN